MEKTNRELGDYSFTKSIKKFKELKITTGVTLGPSDLRMVDEYAETMLSYNRSDTIRDFIKLGYLVWKNLEKIKDPELAMKVKEQVEEGGIVDFVRTLDHRDFDILTSVIKTEMQARGVKEKKGYRI